MKILLGFLIFFGIPQYARAEDFRSIELTTKIGIAWDNQSSSSTTNLGLGFTFDVFLSPQWSLFLNYSLPWVHNTYYGRGETDGLGALGARYRIEQFDIGLGTSITGDVEWWMVPEVRYAFYRDGALALRAYVSADLPLLELQGIYYAGVALSFAF